MREIEKIIYKEDTKKNKINELTKLVDEKKKMWENQGTYVSNLIETVLRYQENLKEYRKQYELFIISWKEKIKKIFDNYEKKLEPPVLSKPNYFVKTGINYTKSKNNYNKNYNREGRNILRTHSFEENDEYKDKDQQDPQQKYISKSKTHSKYKHMKSSSGHIIINHINQNKDNNTIQCSCPRKSINNCIRIDIFLCN